MKDELEEGPSMSSQPDPLKKAPRAGHIDYNPRWELTRRRRIALKRLAELGVGINSSAGTGNYVLYIPFHLDMSEYLEIGYLMAQLGDERFPEGCITLSNVYSDVMANSAPTAPVEFADAYPDSLKYRVNPKPKLNLDQLGK